MASTSADYSCISSALEMIKSIPEVEDIITNQKYKNSTDKFQSTEILDEISSIFKNKTQGCGDLIDLLSYYSDSPQKLYSRWQNLEELFFDEIFKVVKTELHYSCSEVQNTWKKFTAGIRKFIELKVTNDQTSRSITDTLNKDFRHVTLPDFLFVKLPNLHRGKPPYFPETNVMHLNKHRYKIACIINYKDGQYSTITINNCAYLENNGGRLRYLSGREVRRCKNYAYLYVKVESNALKKNNTIFVEKREYRCKVKGCPADTSFENEETLHVHIEQEHRKCSCCNEVFLARCLYEEHVKYCRTKAKEASSSNQTTSNPKFDIRKRKISNDLQPAKKVRFDEERNLCKNTGCNQTGFHWCHYPPVYQHKNGLNTAGKIFTDTCLVDGIPYYSQFLCSFHKSHGIVFLFKYSGGSSIRITSINNNENNHQFNYEITLSGNTFSSKTDGVVGDEKKLAIFGHKSSSLCYEITITQQ